MIAMSSGKLKKIKKFFDLYTSGLGRNEVETLLKKDTIHAYSYLKAKTIINQNELNQSKFKKFLYVVKQIFVSFILQLKPARRLVYGIGIILFILGILLPETSYIILSVLILNFLLALELVDKLTTRDELEIAREIQLSLQPDFIPEYKQLSISTYSKPAKIVGGDFFDVVQPCKHQILCVIGDVSDKGMSAALYAAFTQSMFQSLSETKSSPSQILASLNHLIGRRLRSGDFITLAMVLFDMEENSVTITRAGHNWPLYYSNQSKSIQELKPRGSCIGMMDTPSFSKRLEEQKIFFKQGDFLLLYTDGVTEAFDAEKKMFNISNLKSAIQETVHKSSQDVIDHINHQLNTFVNSDDLDDDATMVAFKMK